MRRFAAGVAVLTLRRPYGVTIGSLLSGSREPPLVPVRIVLDSQAHELIRDEGGFALSLLAGDQEALAQRFARSTPPIALFEGVAVHEGTRGPLLEDALAWIECRIDAAHRAGDHTIFVGAVERIQLGRDTSALVYRHGRYVAV